MKYCTRCEQTKELTEFHKKSRSCDGRQSRCKVCVNAQDKKYYQNNREKYNAKSKKWQQNNREKHNALVRKSSKCPEAKKRTNARFKKRYHSDPQFRLLTKSRGRLRKALKGKNKSASTMTLLGCSIPHLKDHLEKQFIPGMTWANQGKWHIDHMMPCASFELSDPEQQRQCFHYTNLQPMWSKENISKGDTILYNRVWTGSKWINN